VLLRGYSQLARRRDKPDLDLFIARRLSALPMPQQTPRYSMGFKPRGGIVPAFFAFVIEEERLQGQRFIPLSLPMPSPRGPAPLAPQKPSRRGCAFIRRTMDDLTKRGTADRSRISMQEVWEEEYLTKELGASKNELRRIIKKVGDSAAAVRKELGLLGTRSAFS